LFFDNPVLFVLSLDERFNEEFVLLLLFLETFEYLFLLKVDLRLPSISFLLRLVPDGLVNALSVLPNKLVLVVRRQLLELRDLQFVSLNALIELPVLEPEVFLGGVGGEPGQVGLEGRLRLNWLLVRLR